MTQAFRLRYMLGSCMYGTTALADILPQVHAVGAEHIDIWPRVHGDQREQVEAMGEAGFVALLAEHRVGLGCSTRFDLGPFGLQEEMPFVARLGAQLLVTGSKGPKGLEGAALKTAVQAFAQQLEPQIAAAAEHGVVIAIENHGNALIESPDSMKWLVDLCASPHLGIALAPYHLPDDAALVARLIEALGDGLALFYGWQHGMGCHEKRPKEQELMQLPGRGPMDFTPIVASLKKIGYAGFTEIFMHPVPRGVPILEGSDAVSAEINRARAYLEACLAACC